MFNDAGYFFTWNVREPHKKIIRLNQFLLVALIMVSELALLCLLTIAIKLKYRYNCFNIIALHKSLT